MSRYLMYIAQRGSSRGLRPAEALAIAGPRPDPAAALPVPEAVPTPVVFLPDNPAAVSPASTPASLLTERSADSGTAAGPVLKDDSAANRPTTPPAATVKPDPPPAPDPPVAAPAPEAARRPGARTSLAATGWAQSGPAPTAPPAGGRDTPQQPTAPVSAAPNVTPSISMTAPASPESMPADPRREETGTRPSGPPRPAQGQATPVSLPLPPAWDVGAPPINAVVHSVNSEGLQPGTPDLAPPPTAAGGHSSATSESKVHPFAPAPGEMTVSESSVPKPDNPGPAIPGDHTGPAAVSGRSESSLPGARVRPPTGRSAPMTSPDDISAAPAVAAAGRRPAGAAHPVPVMVRPIDTIPQKSTVIDAAPMQSKPVETPSPMASKPLPGPAVSSPPPTVVVPRPKTKTTPVPARGAGSDDRVGIEPHQQSLRIRIGSVEVRASTPSSAPAAPRRLRAAVPRGFDNYRHKRSYQGWGW